MRKLRKESGYLTVDDPELLYAMEIPELEDETWSWKVHIPAGGRYVLYQKVGDVPPPISPPKLPSVPTPPHNTLYPGLRVVELRPGEMKYTLAVRRGMRDSFYAAQRIKWANGDLHESRLPIESVTGRWPRTQMGAQWGGVAEELVEADPTKPLVILHYTPDMPAAAGASPDKRDGMLVWIVRIGD